MRKWQSRSEVQTEGFFSYLTRMSSQKKLFSNKPDVPENSKQGKENLDDLALSRLQQVHLTLLLPTLMWL
ncbi:hypothetical protein Tco_1387892 [Tanacetum coccineum]